MSHIKSIFRVFIYVVAGNTIGATIFLTLFNRDFQFTYVFLWQFIVIAAACSLGNFIFWSGKELSKKQMKVRNIIHYLYESLIVVGGGFICGWVESGQSGYILFLFGIFTVIYMFITTSLFKSDKKTAEDLNKILKKYNVEED